MAIAIEHPGDDAGGISRGRGGFMRSKSDTPYVTDPCGATVKGRSKKDPRAGQPKRIPYGSPSGAGGLIENSKNLEKWGERRVVLGLGRAIANGDYSVLTQAFELATLEVDSDDYKQLADQIVVHAKDIAEASLAADRGTHHHALTEDRDQDRDWILRAQAGEDLGVATEIQQQLVDAWDAMLVRDGLEVLAVEASCVDDDGHYAGTLDRIARTTKPLRFAMPSAEIVVIPADTVLVLDVKTGRRRTDNKGVVEFWRKYAIQILSYAISVPYDTETEVRGEWAWPICREHALIAHLDVLRAIDGNPEGTPLCQLTYVDLVGGRDGYEVVKLAKAWNKRNDLFSVGQLEHEPEIATPEAIDTSVEPPPTDAAPSVGETAHPAPTGVPAGDDPAPAPGSSPALTPQQQRALLPAGTSVIDEGSLVDDPTFNALQARFQQLDDDARGWIKVLFEHAAHGLVSFHAKGARTVRRFEIIRGLVTVAGTGTHSDDMLRALLSAVIPDLAWLDAIHPGHLVGCLDHRQATQFAAGCDTYAGELTTTDLAANPAA